MIGLTPRQADLLALIANWPHPWSPSFDEMREGCGLESNSGIQRLIDGLEERGYIYRLRHRARAIELTPAAREAMQPRIMIRGRPYRFITKAKAEA